MPVPAAPAPGMPPAHAENVPHASAAFVGAVLWWLENNFPRTAEQFALRLGQPAGVRRTQTVLPTELDAMEVVP